MANEAHSLAGQTLGRYQLVEKLGRGGMADVYKAFDPHLNRYVAIKVISPVQPSGDVITDGFMREARSLAAFSHPNIVQIYDYGEEDGTIYLVMEYISGGTLAQLTGRPLHYQEAARLLVPVARALQYAHANHVVHRDVKPANILLRNGQPVLSDFGISKMFNEAQTLGRAAVGYGTPLYMSPEQCQGMAVDPRTDIYSLGVVFFELLTGRPPFTADTPWAIGLQHIQEPPPRLQDVAPWLPPDAQRILDRLLAKDPNQRYPNMDAVVAELETLVYHPPETQPLRRAGWRIPFPGRRDADRPFGEQPAAAAARSGKPGRTFFIMGGVVAACLLAALAAALILWPSGNSNGVSAGLLTQVAANLTETAIPGAAGETPIVTDPSGVPLTPTPTSAAPPTPAAPPAGSAGTPAVPSVPPPAPTAPSGDIDAQVDAAVRSYYQAINTRNYDSSWQMLSDNFKASGVNRDDFDAYVNWWNGFERVDVLNVDVDVVNADTGIANANVRLRYHYLNGRDPLVESYVYRMVYNPDLSIWQIDL